MMQIDLQNILQVEKWIDPKTGKSTGRIKHPDSLLRAVQTLVIRSKVNAVAVVGRFPDDDTDDVDEYRQGLVWQWKLLKLYDHDLNTT
jgi:hypothetical protein